MQIDWLELNNAIVDCCNTIDKCNNVEDRKKQIQLKNWLFQLLNAKIQLNDYYAYSKDKDELIETLRKIFEGRDDNE